MREPILINASHDRSKMVLASILVFFSFFLIEQTRIQSEKRKVESGKAGRQE
jgi:hypothetical protein